MMTTNLVVSFLLSAIMAAPVHGPQAYLAVKPLQAGLVDDVPDTAPSPPASDDQNACTGVTFTRGLKYGENDLNVVDVATGDAKPASPRPVLMFVEGKVSPATAALRTQRLRCGMRRYALPPATAWSA